MKDFRERGKQLLSTKVYNELAAEIAKIQGDCDFLVYGFDSKKVPHIFTVIEPGTDEVWDKPGFTAIGAGKYVAESILYQLGQTIDKGTPEAIFTVCAAKFAAERIPGVGKETFLFVKRPGCKAFTRPSWLLPTIRDVWEKQGQARMPEGIMNQFDLSALGFW
jgi:hypothetical protein